jgi:hypothetical protein
MSKEVTMKVWAFALSLFTIFAFGLMVQSLTTVLPNISDNNTDLNIEISSTFYITVYDEDEIIDYRNRTVDVMALQSLCYTFDSDFINVINYMKDEDNFINFSDNEQLSAIMGKDVYVTGYDVEYFANTCMFSSLLENSSIIGESIDIITDKILLPIFALDIEYNGSDDWFCFTFENVYNFIETISDEDILYSDDFQDVQFMYDYNSILIKGIEYNATEVQNSILKAELNGVNVDLILLT